MQKEFFQNIKMLRFIIILIFSILLINTGCYSHNKVLNKKVTIYALPLSSTTQINIEKKDIKKVSTIRVDVHDYEAINRIIGQSKKIKKIPKINNDKYLIDVRGLGSYSGVSNLIICNYNFCSGRYVFIIGQLIPQQTCKNGLQY
ncbi:MAG: hypothetical protein ABFS35_19865 [Bacteroidota bacterium]